MKSLVLIATFAAFVSVSVQAYVPVPRTSPTRHSAAVQKTVQIRPMSEQRISSPTPVVISVTPVLMASPWSPDSLAAQDSVIADALANSFPKGDLSVPTGYAAAGGKANWFNLVTASTVPLWNGVQNPTGAFAGRFGAQAVVVIRAQTVDRSDNLSLADLNFVSRSSDSGNVLGDTLNFVGTSYTAEAVLVKSDGSIINSGASDQKGRGVIVIVFPKLFNGGDSATGLQQVKNWVSGQGNFADTFKVTAFGDETTASYASVSLNGYAERPQLAIDRQKLWIANSVTNRSYVVRVKHTTDGAFTPYALITGNSAVTLTPDITNVPASFFQVEVQ